MSQIAHEVSRRMTPEYAKERAREMAWERMGRARERAVESGWFMPLVGAGVGALVARALQSRAQERGWDHGRDPAYAASPRRGYYAGYGRPEDYDVYTGAAATGGLEEGEAGSGPSVGERASEVKERARAKAGEVKDRLRDATSSVRDRLPDRERLRESAREDTGLWALGAMALGALFGFALPETRRERELLEPARRKARELGEQARDLALEKGTQAMDRATETVRSAGTGEDAAAAGGPAPGTPTPGAPTPLH